MRAESITLDELAAAVAPTQSTIRIGPDIGVSDLEHDSRRIAPGVVFIAVPGATADGHDFAGTAVGNGAAAVIGERPLDVPVPQLVIDNTRRAMGELAAIVHGHPAADMTMVGITGTNGKTTVTHILEGIARCAGMVTGLVGTIGAHIGEEEVPLRHTTPEATELHRLFATMRTKGVEVVMTEVSSHALDMGRVDGITFDVAGFTNLSQDHLDYHHTMDRYFAAKAELFTPQRARRGYVVVGDAWGRRLAAGVTIPLTTVALDGEADISGITLDSTIAGTKLAVDAGAHHFEVATPLAGWFNATNALLAAAIAAGLGWPDEAIRAGIAQVGAVAGRYEPVDCGQSFTVIVDYAHTPEAMGAAVSAARALTAGRVIALGGAGGDRDTEKRPAMGAALGSADLAVITSDNPRSEDPAAIVDAVAAGVPSGIATVIEVDRRSAIRAALAAAGGDDIVLLLGRGHEPVQDLGDRTIAFSDREVAADLLTEMIGGVA